MDRFALATRIIELLERPLAAQGFELLDVRIFVGGGRTTLRLYLDREDGIGVDDLAVASRTAGMLLEEADAVAEAYVIEASSPGIRRPLRTRDHFAAAVGQDVILKTATAGGKPRSWKGRLTAVDDHGLVLAPETPEGEPRRVERASLREANLDPVFDAQALVNADRRRRKDERKEARETRREQRRKD